MVAASQGRPPARFERPEGIVVERIDPASGLLAYEGQEEAIQEELLDGTAPGERAVPPDAVDPDAYLMEQTEEETPHDGGPPRSEGSPSPAVAQ